MSRLRDRPAAFLATATASIERERPAFLRESTADHTFEPDIGRVHPDPNQPRQTFDEAEIAALAESLRSEGLIQPIAVRQHPDKPAEWMIVAGERRWRAAQLLGWSRIMAIHRRSNSALTSLVENVLRQNLTAIELARAVDRAINNHKLTQVEIGRGLGMSQPRISKLRSILKLPADFLDGQGKELSESVLFELARLDPATRAEALSLAEPTDITVQSIRATAIEMAERAKQASNPLQLEPNRPSTEDHNDLPKEAQQQPRTKVVTGLAPQIGKITKLLRQARPDTGAWSDDDWAELNNLKSAIDALLIIKNAI